MRLLPGKVPIEILKKIIFKHLGVKRDDVILGATTGEDAAILKVGDEVLALSSDPITGAEKWLGWLAVHVNANDIATRGIRPLWFNSIILLPKNSKVEIIKKICTQMDKAARMLDIAITGGHCEITSSLNYPVVTGCAMGIAKNGKYVNCSGAKVGDKIILTKGIGIEGTAILASDRKKELLKIFNKKFLKKAENYFEKISVVKEAMIAFETGGVSAMHDPTEGGAAGGLHELADAANVGFNIFEEDIIISEETRKICDYFSIDPLNLISSGSLLILAKKPKINEIFEKFSKNDIQASIIGEIIDQNLGRTLIRRNGKKEELIRPKTDHLWKALEKQS
jgi:hydrogenase maturation factor